MPFVIYVNVNMNHNNTVGGRRQGDLAPAQLMAGREPGFKPRIGRDDDFCGESD